MDTLNYVGKLVKRFESGTKGSLSLSGCGNDWGLSCGSYQLTLRFGNCIKFLKKYFKKEASSLYFIAKTDLVQETWPGEKYCSSPDEVKKVWTACVKSVGVDTFFGYEHEYIKAKYYDTLVKKLSGLFNPDIHSRMAQECLWSWSVHKGAGGAYTAFKAAVKGKDPQKISATELIDILYDKRYEINDFTRYKKGAGKSSEREALRPYCNDKPLNGTDVETKTTAIPPVKVTDKPVTPAKTTTLPKKKAPTVKKINGVVTVTYRGKSGVSLHKKPEFSDTNHDTLIGPVGPGYNNGVNGSVFTVIGKVQVGDSYMYKLKSGVYITADEKYVKFVEA